MPKTDPKADEEPLPTAVLTDLVWDKELVPDSRKSLCIHEIPRPATPTQPHSPATLALQPNQGVQATLPQQPAK